MKLLLNAGIDVNATNDYGSTPLHTAVITCFPGNLMFDLSVELLTMLLDGGAYHDFVNNYGKSAMDLAQTDEARVTLAKKRKLEQRCIAAKAVKKFEIPFLGTFPKQLKIH